jgi:hypothetical protein
MESKVIARVPNRFESRTRSVEPPKRGVTFMRNVWSVNG